MDPVCGMEVDEQKPGTTYEHRKKTYYFCSPECRDEFEKSPEDFI